MVSDTSTSVPTLAKLHDGDEVHLTNGSETSASISVESQTTGVVSVDPNEISKRPSITDIPKTMADESRFLYLVLMRRHSHWDQILRPSSSITSMTRYKKD